MLRIVITAAPLLLIGANVATGQAVGQRVSVNGMQMYYEVTGAGDPLIVLHGAYMSIPTMGAIIPALEKEPMKWEADVKLMKTPVLIITGDADVATLELPNNRAHSINDCSACPF